MSSSQSLQFEEFKGQKFEKFRIGVLGPVVHWLGGEIEQGLSEVAKSKVTVSFTPHLMPMSRGMQSTIYVEMAPGASVEDLYQHFYEKEEFVILLLKNEIPHTRHVRGSNCCLMNVFPDRIPGRATIICVIDNLVKGASITKSELDDRNSGKHRPPLPAFVSVEWYFSRIVVHLIHES